ncbi:hypothetical protein POM88_052896 [Heracleum sosnowskyi]|uniref:Uncharacterized protein n=1 Tax=Heracleum sosnowskyi TaxID=360622 RepID=A0AAD8LYF8_9APIA|nr:hypothetical protein POM88_052896 [Heracleum sosnowskyi]
MQVEPSIKKELVEELQKVINSQASIAVNGKVKIVVPNLGVKYTRTEALPTVAVYALFKAAIEVELFLSHKRHTNAPASKMILVIPEMLKMQGIALMVVIFMQQ